MSIAGRARKKHHHDKDKDDSHSSSLSASMYGADMGMGNPMTANGHVGAGGWGQPGFQVPPFGPMHSAMGMRMPMHPMQAMQPQQHMGLPQPMAMGAMPTAMAMGFGKAVTAPMHPGMMMPAGMNHMPAPAHMMPTQMQTPMMNGVPLGPAAAAAAMATAPNWTAPPRAVSGGFRSREFPEGKPRHHRSHPNGRPTGASVQMMRQMRQSGGGHRGGMAAPSKSATKASTVMSETSSAHPFDAIRGRLEIHGPTDATLLASATPVRVTLPHVDELDASAWRLSDDKTELECLEAGAYLMAHDLALTSANNSKTPILTAVHLLVNHACPLPVLYHVSHSNSPNAAPSSRLSVVSLDEGDVLSLAVQTLSRTGADVNSLKVSLASLAALRLA